MYEKLSFKYFFNSIDLNFSNNVDNRLKDIIYNVVVNYFPNLIKEDINVLQVLTLNLVYFIIEKFFDISKFQEDEYKKNILKQFCQNNFRDIKAIMLMILPFIDGKNDNENFNNLYNLNQILYKHNLKNIPEEILQKSLSDTTNDEFKISNFSIGLLNDKDVLQLIDEKNEKLIYHIIKHNYIALLESIKILNGKLYINWVNIEPITIENYNEKSIYKNTVEEDDIGEMKPSKFLKDSIFYIP